MTSIESKRKILREIDKDFQIEVCPISETYKVTHRGGHFQTIPWTDFTKETVENIRKTVYTNRNGSIIEELDEHNFKREQAIQKQKDEMIHETAKEVGKPLYNLLKY